MTLHDSPSWTRPDSSPSPSVPTTPAGASGAASFLLARGLDPRRESRRIAFGLVALAVTSVILLNLGIYQSAQTRLVLQRWDQLTDNTDQCRDEMHRLLLHFERQARYVAGQASLRDWSRQAAGGALSASEAAALDAELERAARTFDFAAIEILTPDGRALARTASAKQEIPPQALDLVRHAAGAQSAVMGDLPRARDGAEVLAVAVPLAHAAAGARVPVAVFASNVDEILIPALRTWPGFGPRSGAYLVRQDGDQIVYISAPPAGQGLSRGARVPSQERRSRAAAMAAAGVESKVEVPVARGATQWAVTRFLPEISWGLVGQADRSAVDSGMRGTLFGLLVLDLAMAVLAISAFWFWRRQYASGLARREMEVTRRHAERVQSVFDTAFDAILTFDRNGRVRTVNRAAEQLFGRTAVEMEGQPLHRFLHRGEAGRAAGASGTPGAVTCSEALRADGMVIPVEFSLGSAGEGDELVHTAIVRDIRERVEAEKRIRAFAEGLEVSNRRLEEMNAQLEEASRLKSEFLANTSHELRTPLNGMIGFLQLVLDGMCDSPDEEREFLRQALQCSRHLLGLINDVLDIAKIEAGKLTLDIEPVDVQALFDEVYTVTHVQAAQQGIALHFQPSGDRSVRARGDFGKIKQILINLVGNSLKFTPSGSITVRASAHPDLGHVMFDVTDTGIGITSERQKLVFEKFTQGDGSTTRKYGGTGLGLAISRSLVELMGGIIGVHSEGEGKGTRMYFSLPVWHDRAAEAPEEDDRAGEVIAGPSGGALVLVVEDDPVFRHYLATLLHQNGYRTVEARHAEAGWMLARRLRPSVVVLDYALTCAEGANLRTGWDLAERMTTDSKTRHIPLIFVTGFDQELRDKLKATAFARKPHHLMKPIDGTVLLAKIQELVGSTQGRVVRILMADDDPSVAAYVRKVLPEERFHLEIAANGEQCLYFLRTQPRGFDLLLLDLMMPQVSGYDVLREMTLTGTSTEVPVLVLTNFPEPRSEEEKRLLDDGLVVDVLPKSAVHDSPQLLPHIIDWHIQVATDTSPDAATGDPSAADLGPEEQAA